jgi:hypothetical protein
MCVCVSAVSALASALLRLRRGFSVASATLRRHVGVASLQRRRSVAAASVGGASAECRRSSTFVVATPRLRGAAATLPASVGGTPMQLPRNSRDAAAALHGRAKLSAQCTVSISLQLSLFLFLYPSSLKLSILSFLSLSRALFSIFLSLPVSVCSWVGGMIAYACASKPLSASSATGRAGLEAPAQCEGNGGHIYVW